MSEWNLSVRLTGQGSDLASTLRDSASEARKLAADIDDAKRALTELRAAAADDITVRLDLDAGHLRADVDAALQGAGGQGLTARLDLDADHLRDEVSAALSSAGANQGLSVRLDLDAGHLRDDVNDALTTAGAGQGLSVDLRLGNAMQLRRDVENAVRWAAWGQRIEIPLVLADRMSLRRDVSDAVRWASMNQTINVRIRADTSGLGDLTRTLNPGGGGGGGFDLGLKGLLPLAAAAIPLIAGLAANTAPLAGTFAATGAAATAFTIALAGQIGPLGEAAEAEQKYQDAVRDHGKTSAEAAEAQLAYQRQLAQMPPETQRAAVALSTLKSEFTDWSDDMAGFTMAPVEKGFTVLQELLPHLSPEVESFSGQLDRLADVAGGAISTPGFDAISEKVAALTDAQLDAFTDQVIHLLRIVSEGDADAGTIGQILGYFRENGPAAREAVDAIGDAVSTLAQGAAQAGPTLLTLVTAAARLVAALPPEMVAIILQTVTALKLLSLAGAGAAAAATGITRVRTAITGLAATAASAGGGLAGLRAAFLSLGTAAKASVVVAGVAVTALAISKLMNLGREAPPNIDRLTTSLGKLGKSGNVSGELSRLGDGMEDLYDKVRNITDPAVVDNLQNGLVKVFSLGFADSTPSKEAREWLDGIDESLTNLVKGGKTELAAAAFERLKAAYAKQGGDPSKFAAQMKDYKAALEDARFEQELAAASQGLFGQAAQETSAKLNAQKAAADGLRQAITALNDVNRAAGSAMSAFEQSLDDATKAAREHGNALKMRDGELDLGTQKSRDAEKVLSTLAANTDAAAAAAREQGKSWEHVSGIYSKGRQAFVDAADSMGLTRAQAEALADSYLKIPDKKSTVLEMRTEDAITGLNSVIAAIKKTPDAKSVTVKALTTDAQSMLEELGYKVEQMPDGTFKVSASTGDAKTGLDKIKALRDGLKDKSIKVSSKVGDAIEDLETLKKKVAATKGKTVTMRVPTQEGRKQLEMLGFKIKSTKGKNVTISVPTGSQRANVGALASAIAGLRNRSVTVTYTTVYRIKGRPGGPPSGTYYGSTAGRSADGNIYAPARVQRFAEGGMREQHVAQIAQPTFRMWAEPETGGEAYIPFAWSKRPRSRAIAEETVRRLGGDPATIQWNAEGSVTDWRYDPQTGSLYSPSDAGSAGNKTRKVKGKEISYFDLGAVEKKLKSTAAATRAWNADLEKVADRVGGDVAEALASMGKEGEKLADKMARGSTKYINDMAKALRDLQKTAKASLTDYTRQLGSANKLNKEFSDDLALLAARGYGDLAKQLAAQNDKAAQELADAAVKDPKKAASANAAAKTANNALTGDQVEQLVAIIAAITSSKTGIHDVAATTGLGEDAIVATATKATSQIKTALGARATRFLADLVKAQKGLAFENGGIRSGIYATKNGAVTFAEPSTGGEAFIPLGASKRRHALPVLSDVAGRFGLGLRDAGEGRVIVIRQPSPLVGTQNWNVTSGGDAADTARRIDADNSYQLRRLARGGVGARE
ncbi:hypothetical protein AB0933_32395 [Streptomyces venezuelae]|uniref:hypothetical protein n=1 Tax=Streptomyces venezuelae TaxID=54571 RepID=UPI0034571F83